MHPRYRRWYCYQCYIASSLNAGVRRRTVVYSNTAHEQFRTRTPRLTTSHSADVDIPVVPIVVAHHVVRDSVRRGASLVAEREFPPLRAVVLLESLLCDVLEVVDVHGRGRDMRVLREGSVVEGLWERS
jgi:hypothetical protein